ncbi:hypothetical protein KUF83_06155 [Streptomyces sp. BV286]|uniref:hypothetical protein n=1 Tax=unclassified Streptomyces TaxID=2593676 RepID=UPI001C2EECF3|nr:hypothetical protein [Streptomyces sp. BV286]MBV1936147.1 hypothetical protein [Streptomyces sp. BV286]
MSVRPGPQVTGRTARFGRGMLPEMGDTRADRFADRCRSGSGSGRSPRDRYGGGRSAARRTDRPRTDGVAVGRQTYGAAAMVDAVAAEVADSEAPVADTEAAPVVLRLAEVADIVAAPVADAVAAPVVLRLGGRRVRSRRGSRR